MSSKLRLWMNLIAIVSVFTLIIIAVGAIFVKSSRFLNVPEVENKVKDLNLEIVGTVNEQDFFAISYTNGKPNKETDIKLDRQDTTFTEENPILTYLISLKNKSNGKLYVRISGIYFDEFERFETTVLVLDEVREPVKKDGKGVILFEIDNPPEGTEPSKENNSIVDISLVYQLKKYNRPIDNAKQDLEILIQSEPIGIDGI